MTRLVKQLLYGAFYIAIILAVIWWFYRQAVPAPTCSDNIQNQTEEGVDCGAVCGHSCLPVVKALEVLPVQFIHNSDGSWDSVAHLENPNGIYGASAVPFTLSVKDDAGTALAVQHQTTYVNPAQPQYIVIPLGKLSSAPATASLQFAPADVTWAALTLQAAGTVEFAVRGDSLSAAVSTTHYQATVTNRSTFDFDQVDITVLLYDATDMLVGAGSTIAKTVVAGETRAFAVDWPFGVPGAVRAQAFVGTNIFSNANFIRAYGSQEKFQGF